MHSSMLCGGAAPALSPAGCGRGLQGGVEDKALGASPVKAGCCVVVHAGRLQLYFACFGPASSWVQHLARRQAAKPNRKQLLSCSQFSACY
jgi:hypothetical protein